MRTLECFAGIGGFALAWERLGFSHVQFVEYDPYCQAVLREHWPEVPIHGDIRTFDAKPLRGRVDLVSGGPPCQPASVAGKRKGHEDERWLWPEFLRVVDEVAPTWVVAENPTGLISLKPHGLDWVSEQLEAQGYELCPIVLGADSVGAPHRRKRVFVIGHRISGNRLADAVSDDLRNIEQRLPWGWQGGVRDEGEALAGGDGTAELADRNCGRREGSGEQEPRGIEGSCGNELDGRGERGTVIENGLVHSAGSRLEGYGADAGEQEGRESRGSGASGHRWPARPGERQYEWEPPRLTEIERGLDRDAHGLPYRVESRIRRERLKALGNSVVSQIPEAIGRAILSANKEMM